MLVRAALLLVLLIASMTLNLCFGDVSLTPAQAFSALFSTHPPPDIPGLKELLWQIRVPRLLVAVLVGGALATSGYILQALSRNQLADPYLTGVSAGAGLAIALGLTCGLPFALIPLVAFAGGLAASTVVALMSRSPSGLSVTRLLLSGVGLSAICSAFITLIVLNSPSFAQMQGIFFWLAGGISGRAWSELIPASLYTLVGVVIALLMSKQIRLLSLGALPAQALGLNVARTQWILLAAAVLLCGAAVSVSGLVGFVGLIAPHVSRRLFARDERVQIICSAAAGAVLVSISDLVARLAAQGQELPLGTLLSLVGGPFFLLLVCRQKGENL